MDFLLTLIGKFVPVGFSLLSLWIKAFDDTHRLTRAGGSILIGLGASAILVYSADRLDKQLSEISDRRKSEALYEKISEANTVKPEDVKLTLAGSSESKKARSHPKHLFADWKVCLQPENDSKGLLGSEIYGWSDPDDESGDQKVFQESRTFSNFKGEFANLVRPENWNGADLQVRLVGQPDFFPETLDDWVVTGHDLVFASNSKKEYDEACSEFAQKPIWRMLPMSIHAELSIKGKSVAKRDGYIVFSCANGQKKPRVFVKMPPLSVAEDAFSSKTNFVRPLSDNDRHRCLQFRILGWLFSILAVASGGIAARVQLQSLQTASN
jgi:hypothetical protein